MIDNRTTNYTVRSKFTFGQQITVPFRIHIQTAVHQSVQDRCPVLSEKPFL